MGNALKVVWAAPFVQTGESKVEIATRGILHRISISMDRIAGVPEIDHKTEHLVRNESSISISWPDSSRLLIDEPGDSYNDVMTAPDLISRYAAVNPHAEFTYNGTRYERTDPDFKKWNPDAATSAHWYTVETLRDLIAGYLVNERSGGKKRTVREFVSEFKGLSSTKKQAEVTGEWSRDYLHAFVTEGNDIDREFLRTLLERMKELSTPPKPTALGKIGEEHISQWLIGRGAAPGSVRYTCLPGSDDIFPHIVEVAFAVNTDDTATRQLFIGMNWSPALEVPGQSINEIIQQQRIDPADPVLFFVHIARPRFEFMDRGKTRIEL
jgi:hypothetical protein